jgi:DNA-binding transcriptional ArsR family regulator
VALKGTLKDFGIAEILQLIGQQAKSGVLHLESRDDLIHIAIADGNVVRAESAGRKTRERLGTMFVRAEIIKPEELAYALDVQKRSLRRLGDILVELKLVTKEDLRELTALQTTETIYRLFHWKSGTYEFEPGDVEWDPETVTALRAESVLMEGFRRVDEWPLIRKKITSTAMTFERLRAVEPEKTGSRRVHKEKAADDVDAAFDSLGEEPEVKRGEFASLGRNERRCNELAIPGRTVEKIVDLSRLGEFEACKALLNLANLGYLKPIPPANRAAAAVGAYAQDWQARLRRGAARVLATLAIAAALAGIAYWVDRRGLAFGAQGGTAIRDNTAQRFLGRYQIERLRSALEIYRLERGEYPERLGGLVEVGLASGRDLRYPWSQDYYYRRDPAGRFVLLPPVE